MLRTAALQKHNPAELTTGGFMSETIPSKTESIILPMFAHRDAKTGTDPGRRRVR
jgi:hypothetical protein